MVRVIAPSVESGKNLGSYHWLRSSPSFFRSYITKPIEPEEVFARVETHLFLRDLQKRLEDKNDQLQKAMAEIKILRGIIPICAYCKKIRKDDGYWEQLEQSIREHSEAEFSHGICQTCSKKLFEDLSP